MLCPQMTIFVLPLGFRNFLLRTSIFPFDQKKLLKRCNHYNDKWISDQLHMFRALFYPRRVKIYTMSVTNSMSVNCSFCSICSIPQYAQYIEYVYMPYMLKMLYILFMVNIFNILNILHILHMLYMLYKLYMDNKVNLFNKN